MNRETVSRRSFLKGAALAAGAAGVATMGLAGCTSESAKPTTKWDAETNLLVVGSGYAGLCCAIEAIDQGSTDITIIERSKLLGGNSVLCAGSAQFGGGNVVQQAAGIEDTPNRFYDDILAYRFDRANPLLLRTFVDNANDTVKWLQDMGLSGTPNLRRKKA